MNMNNKKTLLIAICVLVGLLLVSLILLAVLTIGERGNTTPTDHAQSIIVTDPDAPDVEIETPYCTLYYPGAWGKYLKVQQFEGTDYTVSFVAKLENKNSLELFSLIFNPYEENAAAMILQPTGEQIFVHVEICQYTLDGSWTQEEINAVNSMREALNDVMQKLPRDGEDQGEMTIETPYCPLYYPARWKQYLDVRVSEGSSYRMDFYGVLNDHEQLLFTLDFGGTEGIHAASLPDSSGNLVELRVIINEFMPDSTWTAADTRIIYAMQEELNYVLNKLP